jgi:ribosomal protein S12 methylthiotransferase
MSPGSARAAHDQGATVRYWIETLGCPKNQVDSEKLSGLLAAEGYGRAEAPEQADLVVVNTCAFIEEARVESIEVVLDLAGRRATGARLVVTGCMAERYGVELAAAIPEADLVAGFGESLTAPARVAVGAPRRAPSFDLLNLPRPVHAAPWAYVKVAEGCDRRCGFCAIPSFRGDQRSRGAGDIAAEVDALVAGGVKEVVLVAQDLASWGVDRRRARAGAALEALDTGAVQPLVGLVRALTGQVERLRLLYLYPSGLTAALVEAILATGVAYFDLSLQHASRPLLRQMSRWGDGERFLERIGAIRSLSPEATFRSSFILGYPGESEDDQGRLLEFLEAAELDWAGFFPYSAEAGTPAGERDDQVPRELALERLREVAELQDRITARRRDRLVGTRQRVLVDAPGVARSERECPEIDGIVRVDPTWPVGQLVDCVITASEGTDLEARRA